MNFPVGTPWSREWEFCHRPECLCRESGSRLQGRSSMLEWLQRLKLDGFRMLEMRSLVSRFGSEWDPCRFSDNAVIEEIADLLASGRLHIHTRTKAVVPDHEEPILRSGPAYKPEVLVPFPIANLKRLKSDEPRLDFDSPTFPPNTNAAAQAAALIAAAKTGKPACAI